MEADRFYPVLDVPAADQTCLQVYCLGSVRWGRMTAGFLEPLRGDREAFSYQPADSVGSAVLLQQGVPHPHSDAVFPWILQMFRWLCARFSEGM